MAGQMNRAPMIAVGTKVRIRTGLRRRRMGVVEAHAMATARGIELPVLVVTFDDGTRGSYFPDEVEST